MSQIDSETDAAGEINVIEDEDEVIEEEYEFVYDEEGQNLADGETQ